jgi:hypothetical protein
MKHYNEKVIAKKLSKSAKKVCFSYFWCLTPPLRSKIKIRNDSSRHEKKQFEEKSCGILLIMTVKNQLKVKRSEEAKKNFSKINIFIFYSDVFFAEFSENHKIFA